MKPQPADRFADINTLKEMKDLREQNQHLQNRINRAVFQIENAPLRGLALEAWLKEILKGEQ